MAGHWLDQHTLVGESLDGGEVGLSDRCVDNVGAYLFWHVHSK
jgi:hypothetical protein